MQVVTDRLGDAKRQESTEGELGPMADACRWTVIVGKSMDSWDARLLKTDAYISQYPLWNDSLRQPFLYPRYLVGLKNGREVAYACVITIGAGPFKFGIVRGGPVSLVPGVELTTEVLQSFLDWADENRYVFVFFSHENADLLERLAIGRDVEKANLKMWGHLPDALVIELEDDDDRMLARFSKTGRRDIRSAEKAGFIISSSAEPDAFESRWPLVRAMQQRKAVRLNRPLESYQQLFSMAALQGCARVYTAQLAGKPLATILVVRDRDTAHYVTGALDVPGLQGARTPKCLMHWVAMRDFRTLGVRRYSLGGFNPDVLISKQKFHPEIQRFQALAVIFRPGLYRWSRRMYDAVIRAYRFLRRRRA